MAAIAPREALQHHIVVAVGALLGARSALACAGPAVGIWPRRLGTTAVNVEGFALALFIAALQIQRLSIEVARIGTGYGNSVRTAVSFQGRAVSELHQCAIGAVLQVETFLVLSDFQQ